MIPAGYRLFKISLYLWHMIAHHEQGILAVIFIITFSGSQADKPQLAV